MRSSLLFLGLLACTAVSPVRAAQSVSSGQVSMSVVPACRIASTMALNFGRYDALGVHATQPNQASGSVSVVCTNGASNVRVALSQGGNAAAGSSCSAPSRQMASSQGVPLRYEIYQDAARTLPWGCDPQTGVVLPAFGRQLTPVTVMTYGSIPPGQPAPIGEYLDTVEVIVTF